jgi:hypothetical protein
MFLLLLLLSLVPALVPAWGFLPRLPPALFMDSPLEQIVAQRSIVSTFTNRISEELFTDNVFVRDLITNNRQSTSDVFYLTLALLVFYQQNTYSTVKIENMDRFMKTRRITNSILFVILFIFTKNVGVAT